MMLIADSVFSNIWWLFNVFQMKIYDYEFSNNKITKSKEKIQKGEGSSVLVSHWLCFSMPN